MGDNKCEASALYLTTLVNRIPDGAQPSIRLTSLSAEKNSVSGLRAEILIANLTKKSHVANSF